MPGEAQWQGAGGMVRSPEYDWRARPRWSNQDLDGEVSFEGDRVLDCGAATGAVS